MTDKPKLQEKIKIGNSEIEGRYVVFWLGSAGTNTHHFFATYKEATDYAKNCSTGRICVAYLLCYKKPEDLIELDYKELCKEK